jgi:hypothetical protein
VLNSSHQFYNFLALFTIMGRPAGQKIKEDQMPKKMIELQEALKALNGDREVSAHDITTMADKTLRNRATNAMVRTLSTDQKSSYSKCANDKERHQWVAEYLLDPQKVKCEGATSVSRTSTTTDKEVTIWITEAELGGPSYLNNTEHAALAITSLDNRPHEVGALAAAGVKQYKWTTKQHVSGKAVTEAATVGSTAEMSPEQAQMIREHMMNSGNPGEENTRPSKKQKTMLPIEDKKNGDKDNDNMSPEKKAHKAGFSFLYFHCSL